MAVHPQALHFGTPEAPLAGWWYGNGVAQDDASAPVVLMVPAWGDEELSTHAGAHAMAATLAAGGMKVLRFDPAGEGESFAATADEGRISTFLASIEQAGALARTLGGTDRLVVVGVRLGALLASRVIAEGGLAASALVALVPPATGRAHAREMKMFAATVPASTAGPGLQAGGFHLEPEEVRELEALQWPDAGATAPPQLLWIGRSTFPTPTAVIDRVDRWVHDAHIRQHDDLDRFVAIAHDAQWPAALTDEVARWIHDLPRSAVASVSSDRAWSTDAGVEVGAVAERFVRIPTNPAAGAGTMAGTLSAASSRRGSHGVLLLSSGAERRIGPHRLWVEFARHRAASGDTVLRLDLPGIGESPRRSGEAERCIYAADAARDVARAVDWLKAQPGIRSVDVVGICSGAYHAWRAALAGAAVRQVIAINPLVFHWQPGMSMDPRDHAFGQIAIGRDAARALLDSSRWRKLLSGHVHLSVIAGALGGLARLAGRQRWREMARLVHWPLADDLARELRIVLQSGRSVHFVFSENDPGRTLLALETGRALHQLIRRGGLHVRTIPGADHTFTGAAARQLLLDALHEKLNAGPAMASSFACNLETEPRSAIT